MEKDDVNFSEDIIINWLIQLVLVTSYMYNKQIYNGNINTNTVFIYSGSIKVSLFGLNQYLAIEEPTKAITMKEYAAPEVRRGALVHDPLSDIWSIACIIYKLCTKKFPDMTPIEPLPAEYKPQLNKLLIQMLETDTMKRLAIFDLLKQPLINEHIAEKLVLYNMHSKDILKKEQIKVIIDFII